MNCNMYPFSSRALLMPHRAVLLVLHCQRWPAQAIVHCSTSDSRPWAEMSSAQALGPGSKLFTNLRRQHHEMIATAVCLFVCVFVCVLLLLLLLSVVGSLLYVVCLFVVIDIDVLVVVVILVLFLVLVVIVILVGDGYVVVVVCVVVLVVVVVASASSSCSRSSCCSCCCMVC